MISERPVNFTRKITFIRMFVSFHIHSFTHMYYLSKRFGKWLLHHIVISDNILPKHQFFIEKIFLPKEKKKKINFSLFLRQMPTHMVFCRENEQDTFNLKLPWTVFNSVINPTMSHVSSWKRVPIPVLYLNRFSRKR